MHAPAAGELIAELIAEGRTSFDISRLAASRFTRGEPVREFNVI
jgi:glycine/D-amino acid oxidase-like deaminating enzyme